MITGTYVVLQKINVLHVFFRKQLNGIYDTLKNVVTEAEAEDYLGPSSTYAMGERSGRVGGATHSSSFFSSSTSSSNNRNSSSTTSTVFPAPAEALLGISPTTASSSGKAGTAGLLELSESESCTNWAQTFKKHLAQRRALPTTIESFDEEDNNISEVTQYIFMQNENCSSRFAVGFVLGD